MSVEITYLISPTDIEIIEKKEVEKAEDDKNEVVISSKYIYSENDIIKKYVSHPVMCTLDRKIVHVSREWLCHNTKNFRYILEEMVKKTNMVHLVDVECKSDSLIKLLNFFNNMYYNEFDLEIYKAACKLEVTDKAMLMLVDGIEEWDVTEGLILTFLNYNEKYGIILLHKYENSGLKASKELISKFSREFLVEKLFSGHNIKCQKD